MSFQAIDLDTCIGISLLDATLNRAFPNIYSPLNGFVLRITGAGPVVIDYTLLIPPLQYTATTLATAIQAAIVGMGITNVTVSYSAFPVDRFVFTWDGTGPQIGVSIVSVGDNANATIANYIGVTSTMVLVAATPQNAANPPSLSGPDEVYIESDLITNGNCVDVPTLNSSIPYLGKISYNNVPYGFTGVYQATEAEMYQINYSKRFGPTSVRIFDMKLTDRYGNILPLPDNCFIDMHFAVFYNPSRD
jgi:hypothetical protein